MSSSSESSSGASATVEKRSRSEYHRRVRRRKTRRGDGDAIVQWSDTSSHDGEQEQSSAEMDSSDGDPARRVQPGNNSFNGEVGTSSYTESDNSAVHERDEGGIGEAEAPEGDLQQGNENVVVQQEQLILNDSESSANETDSDISDIILEESAESDDSEEQENGDENAKLFEGSPVSLGEYMLALFMFLIRHKLTGEALGDLLSLIAMICPPDNECIKTLYKFKKYFSMIGRSLVVFHYFCSGCGNSLHAEDGVCEHCEPGQKVSYFFELPILTQLQEMFLRPGFYEALQYRFNRVKKMDANIEDIYDGQVYKDHSGFLNNPNNISFLWYTDGIAIFKSTTFSVWPMYLVINELNYKMRTQRENIILAGIWFGSSKPNPNVFLRPLNDDIERLQAVGHSFQRHNGPPVLVKGKVLCGVCDLQAKCRFMRMKQWNGFFGCTNCMISGERYDLGNNKSIHVYPYTPEVNMRRNEDIPEFAEQAVRNRQQNADADVYGIKGPTLLYFLLPNMILGMGIDVMHGVFLGLMKLLTSLWFDASYHDQPFSIHHLLDIVDQRLQNLKPPSYVQKVPRSIKHLISFWKALEYKLWFLYYSLPVLLGVLPEIYWQNHCKIVCAISILLQESISLEQLDEAQDLLNSYVSDFQQLYGLRFMSMNVHQLIHLPNVVRNLGPLWVYNFFFF